MRTDKKNLFLVSAHVRILQVVLLEVCERHKSSGTKGFFPLITSKVAVCEMTSVVVSREIKQCFHTPGQGKLIKSSTGNADAA